MSIKSEKQEKFVSDFKFGIKLQPAHFPVGTVFKVSKKLGTLSEGKDSMTTFTTTGVAYNAPGHFVVRTDTRDEVCGTMRGFSYTHIVEIVKRGDGPVVFDNFRNKILIKSFNEDAISFVYAPKDWRWDKVDTHVCLKTNYLFFTYHDIISVLLAKYKTDPAEFFDYDKIMNALRCGPSTSFIITISSGNKYGTFSGVAGYKANKKRLNQWFKQNINRFKKSVKQAKKEYEDMLRREYEKDYDYLFCD